jgi:vancomycin permeability regulator SanA
MVNFASFGPAKKILCVAASAILLAVIIDLLWFWIKFPAGLKIGPPESPGADGRPALVLGAGVRSNGEPTQVLEGRLRTALNLFEEKKATWILVSGDNRTQYYNEPQAMRRWLVRHGVPPEKIVSDYAGRRTYDSLKRAQMIFGLSSIIVVTSEFHIARALYLAKNMGLDAVGAPSETKSIGAAANINFWFREYLARHKAVWDVWFPPSPRLGPRENTPDDIA